VPYIALGLVLVNVTTGGDQSFDGGFKVQPEEWRAFEEREKQNTEYGQSR
jgi:hypothetical protein